MPPNHPNRSYSHHADIVETFEQSFLLESNHTGRSLAEATVPVDSNPTFSLPSDGDDNDSELDPVEMETNKQPILQVTNTTDSTDDLEVEIVEQSFLPLVNCNRSYHGSQVQESPFRRLAEEEKAVRSMEQELHETKGNDSLENLLMVPDIQQEDLTLRKEDLLLRKQNLLLQRKRYLQDAMNQTLQNYMNPSCPLEIKDALMEQWKMMDLEFKSL
jgi:hypothetical protein